MVSELLLSEGYKVVSAEHGQDALEKMEGGFRPDVILLDLMMPVLNGFDVLRAMHRTPRWSSIPVVIVSANQGHDLVELGAAAIIRKPFDPNVLLKTLRRLLNITAARNPPSPSPRKSPAPRFAAPSCRFTFPVSATTWP